MTEIFRCLAGSRLYGTHNSDSDHDYKAVHLPTKRGILLGNRKQISSVSTGLALTRNTSNDVDVESFELQRFLKLASDMQTIPVEMLFVNSTTFLGRNEPESLMWNAEIWPQIVQNRDKILNRNTKAFVGYCKGQAVRYSMRGKRLETYEHVCETLSHYCGTNKTVSECKASLESIDGATFIAQKQPDGRILAYLDVHGRQCPETLSCEAALKIYQKPVNEAGNRVKAAKDAGGMDNKALYHAIRIADEGISLFRDGNIEFPCQNLPLLTRIRAGEVAIDEILDIFDEKIEILSKIDKNSPLSEHPDRVWIDDFVSDVYEQIVRAT